MRYLYVFPHPDDESFGPALAIANQERKGHEIHLLTLTRGGATRQRERLGLTIAEMGEVRLAEMEMVREVLRLASMEVLDYPDGGLDEIDPLLLEAAIASRIAAIDPDVVVSYPVHGISGHPDHLVAHAAVKGAFAATRERSRRLAFFTLLPADGPEKVPLRTSRPEQVDCEIDVGEEDVERARRALDCYETYAGTIEEHDPLTRVGRTVYFEIWKERHSPRLRDLGSDERESKDERRTQNAER
ncbi:MAG TPA: PIG-L deacetylase family protein [Thermoanaerobaculia bacterium]|nr:PIG-L deacetylase family protein [Thermoanaerobaculia bacterium]